MDAAIREKKKWKIEELNNSIKLLQNENISKQKTIDRLLQINAELIRAGKELEQEKNKLKECYID